MFLPPVYTALCSPIFLPHHRCRLPPHPRRCPHPYPRRRHRRRLELLRNLSTCLTVGSKFARLTNYLVYSRTHRRQY